MSVCNIIKTASLFFYVFNTIIYTTSCSVTYSNSTFKHIALLRVIVVFCKFFVCYQSCWYQKKIMVHWNSCFNFENWKIESVHVLVYFKTVTLYHSSSRHTDDSAQFSNLSNKLLCPQYSDFLVGCLEMRMWWKISRFIPNLTQWRNGRNEFDVAIVPRNEKLFDYPPVTVSITVCVRINPQQ